MKKLMGLFTVLVLSVALVGCGGGSKTTTTCIINQVGVEVTSTFEASGDKVTKEMTSVTMTTETFKLVEKEFDALKGIDGVTIDTKESGSDTIFTMTVDYTKAKIDDLIDAGVIEGVDGQKNVKFISLKETVKALEAQNATCTKK